MSSVPGVDRPAEHTDAELTLRDQGVIVACRVELVHDDVVVVRPPAGGVADRVVVRPGDAVDVSWHNPDGQRTLPAEVYEVSAGDGGGDGVHWRLRATGPAVHTQRRQAVRGRVAVPVTATVGDVACPGSTVDLSETGLRANVRAEGDPPAEGTQIQLVVALEDGPLTTGAEVVRTQDRGTAWLLSLRFVGLPERHQDRVRRRVFQALREERARSAENTLGR
jgi:hypothetical protein